MPPTPAPGTRPQAGDDQRPRGGLEWRFLDDRLGINLTYETTEAVAGKAAQNIMLPVSQKMDILAGTPEVYGTPSKDKEATISVPLTNMGRAKAMNIRVLATDGMTASTPLLSWVTCWQAAPPVPM